MENMAKKKSKPRKSKKKKPGPREERLVIKGDPDHALNNLIRDKDKKATTPNND